MKDKKIFFKNLQTEELISFSNKHFKIFSNFLSTYTLKKSIYGNEKQYLGEKKYYCRFCNQSKQPQHFRTSAHVIPEMLGKAKVLNNFECDDCNEKFSRYENDFGNYTLFERSISGHKGKKGSVKYKNPKTGLEIKSEQDPIKMKGDNKEFNKLIDAFVKQGISPIIIKHGNDPAEVSCTSTKTKYSIKRNPYVPINVFKIFAKIAYSLIDDRDLGDYERVRNFLNEEREQTKNSPLFNLNYWELPYYNKYFNFPIGYLFEPFQKGQGIFDLSFVLLFGNKMYQINLPSKSNFNYIKENKTVGWKIFTPYYNPLFLTNPQLNDFWKESIEEATLKCVNLSNVEQVDNEIEELILEQDADLLQFDFNS